MEELRGVELLPEPGEPKILSVDPSTNDHQDQWRAEVTGWAPTLPETLPYRPRRLFSITSGVMMALFLGIIVVLWQSNLLLLELPPSTSEWAFEQSEIRSLQDDGLSGEGVRVCMVDTGISLTHTSLEDADVVFKDFVGSSTEPVDYGSISHGTLMAGLLISNDFQNGIAPNVTLGMAATLSADGDNNTGSETRVGDAIRWCVFDFEADIISLSLGGEQDQSASREVLQSLQLGKQLMKESLSSLLPETMVALEMMDLSAHLERQSCHHRWCIEQRWFGLESIVHGRIN